MKRFLLTLCALCATTALWAATWTDPETGIEWTYKVSNGKAMIGTGSSSPAISQSTSGAITIPSSLGGKPVTSIEYYAFSDCSGLTSVTIPEGVTSIGERAFYGCSGLTSVTIPDSVTSIGSYAFYYCTGLTSITIPSSVTSIGDWAFEDCTGLTSVTIPEGVTSIGYAAFRGCSGLTSITIPSSVTSIKDSAFEGCSNLKIVVDEGNSKYLSLEGVLFNISMTSLIFCPKDVSSYTIPSSVTSIGSSAFYGCSGLASITIPEGVTSIGDYAFRDCSSLTSITIPEGVTSIGWYAFSGCTGLTSITIPSSVTSIEYYAFSDCSGLTSVTIPEGVISIRNGAFSGCANLTSVTILEGVTSIGWHAFSGCSGLASITIPSSVTSIEANAFSGCSNLKIVVDEGNSKYLSLEGVLFNISMTSLIFCPKDVSSYTIPEGVTSIEDSAFSGCTGLTSVTIPSSVTSIGWHAFSGCSGLTSVTIPEGVTSIGGYAFYDCTGLTSVTIPSSVTSIENYAFGPVKKLLFYPNPDVISLGTPWIETWNLEEVALAYPVNPFGEGNEPYYSLTGFGFLGNEITTITVDNLSAFEDWLYSWQLDTVYLPNSLTYVDDYACSQLGLYWGGSQLKTLVTANIPDCIALPSSFECIRVPEGVEYLDSYALSLHTDNPVELQLPESLKSIGYYAIGLNVSHIHLPKNVSDLPSGRQWFESCDKETLVKLTVDEDNEYFSSENNVLYNKEKTTLITAAPGATWESLTLPTSVKEIHDSAFRDSTGLKSVTLPDGLTTVGWDVFNGCSGLTSFTLPASVSSMPESALPPSSFNLTSLEVAEGNSLYWTNPEKTMLYTKDKKRLLCVAKSQISGDVVFDSNLEFIASDTFSSCLNITSITVPASVTSVGSSAFMGISAIRFEGAPPTGAAQTFFPWHGGVTYPEEYADEWENAIAVRKCQVSIISNANVSVSAKMISAKVMEVSYTINSRLPTAKVRAVAFANGGRSFANVVPVTNGTNVPNGGEVETNTEHTFIWNVFEDWDTDLSKVAIEILVQEGELLPRRRVGVPALNGWEKMTITTNAITSAQAFNALLWCVAEGDDALTIESGVVKVNETQIASGTSVSSWGTNATALLNYLYGKMGYQVLSGSRLTHVKKITRLNLSSSGLDQVAYKIEEEATEE